jgi:hypothetical protein
MTARACGPACTVAGDGPRPLRAGSGLAATLGQGHGPPPSVPVERFVERRARYTQVSECRQWDVPCNLCS